MHASRSPIVRSEMSNDTVIENVSERCSTFRTVLVLCFKRTAQSQNTTENDATFSLWLRVHRSRRHVTLALKRINQNALQYIVHFLQLELG